MRIGENYMLRYGDITGFDDAEIVEFENEEE